jgi:NADPH2:quinone reductase
MADLTPRQERRISPNISHRLPLEDYAKAMRLLMDRRLSGAWC